MTQRTPPSMLEAQARQFLEQHRGRRAIRPAPPAGRAAERVLKPLAARFGVGVEQLEHHWREIVGPRLADWSSPKTIQRQGGISVLVIEARGPAGSVLQAESRRILERVRQYAGQQSPTRIRIIQGRMKARPAASSRSGVEMNAKKSTSQVSEAVEQTPDARLRSALERLDRSVRRRNGE